MKTWKITGVIASVVIVLTIPLYLVKVKYISRPDIQAKQEDIALFVGREQCIDCHKEAYDTWRGSHHDDAMDEATEETVLGDFNNAVFEHNGIRARFYRKENKFYVHTQGPDGEMEDFEIAYTFGITPLQQYLISFPGGRLQSLTVAWDVKEQQWYHLYPDDPNDPGDWLHWTQSGQTWNSMCAECHSTRLQKGYDPNTKSYHTTWSEIDVSCEACHGPGSLHVAWADLSTMSRSQEDKGYELVVQTADMDSQEQVELCAPCHSRRALLGDYSHVGGDLMDNLVPSLLNEPLYYADGQIREEVYVYGSFVQSKMYHNGVRCSDCHDVHSVKLVKQDNELCLQCHRAAVYDNYDHHFHKKEGEEGEPLRTGEGERVIEVGEGAECIKCHMPGRYYMGVDYRPDHSLRIPRPDLSMTIGAPNACNQCHTDQSDEWSAEYVSKWYGLSRKPHYGTTLAAGRNRLPEAEADLLTLAEDQLSPVLVRATALSLLSSYPGEESLRAFKRAFVDEEALIRQTAIRNFNPPDPQEQITFIVPLLHDPVKAVRMAAAMNLTVIPPEQLQTEQNQAFQAALLEYRKSMAYSADFPSSGLNLGNMYANLGQRETAIQHYQEAIRIDRDFFPAKNNLALLYSQMGRNAEAEVLLREILKRDPELYETAYSLGLLLAEKQEFREAAVYLEQAAQGLPDRVRVRYNYALVLQHLGRRTEAEIEMLKATRIDPTNPDIVYALVILYMQQNQWKSALPYARKLMELAPNAPGPRQLMQSIRERIGQ
ncbi:MAG: tetratricopeptide repeat protein [bacterium]|nr:tetratricopeptide repeat protein [bacterium]